MFGLRLLWSDLPGLTVAQLPREFLFSMGVALVVAPAMLVGALAGAYELGQHDQALIKGHQSWTDAMNSNARPRYIAFYAAMPLVLATPGVLIALSRDDLLKVSLVLPIALALTAHGLGVWVSRNRPKRKPEADGSGGSPWDGEPPEPGGPAPTAGQPPAQSGPQSGSRDNAREQQESTQPTSLNGWETLAVFSGILWWGAFAIWMAAVENEPKYFGVIGVSALSLLIAILVVWMRSQAGSGYREAVRGRPPVEGDRGQASATKDRREFKHPAVLQFGLVSAAAAAVLSVPAIIAIAAVVPLREAVACGVSSKAVSTPPVPGVFVGQTATHVYIGDNKRIVAIPTARVSRVIIGKGADAKACTE